MSENKPKGIAAVLGSLRSCGGDGLRTLPKSSAVALVGWSLQALGEEVTILGIMDEYPNSSGATPADFEGARFSLIRPSPVYQKESGSEQSFRRRYGKVLRAC